MNRFLIVILLCGLFGACKPGIPKDIIQPKQMEKVLFDIHVIDGYAASLSIPADSLKKVISPLYKGIYKKHGIDSALYNQSLDYYYKHPDLMKEMYEHITADLTKAKERTEKIKETVAAEAPKPVAADTMKYKGQLTKPEEAVPVPEKAVDPKKVN